jgi:dienelactone hydrolase
LSTYPRDEADFPVGGISWYEAVAYARYRGLELPTIHHWLRAGFSPLSAIFYTTPAIAKASQFEQKGPAAAHSEMGLGPWGTYHMLGNAREWVANFSGNDAIALGSSWLNFPVDCITPYGSDPMRRAPENGLRLMKKLSDSPIDAQLQQPIKLTRDTDVFKRDPVSDEAFKAMRFQFSKAPKPVEVTKQEIERTEMYIVEEVTLKFARDPPMILHLARPTAKQSRPLQAIIFGPGGNCCFMKRDNRDNVENLREADFVPISGRLLVMPVWAGAYERFEPYPLDVTQQLDRGRRNALAWQHDLSASIDYLESLEDVDAQKVGYVGYSMGASVISITLAIENRVKAAVFVSSGLILTYKLHPMSDMMNYAPRITIPVLMMNGRYDHAFSYEKSQLPLFNLLGTPAKDKRQIIYDTGHFAFGSRAVAAEATNWFDQYLGPVR